METLEQMSSVVCALVSGIVINGCIIGVALFWIGG